MTSTASQDAATAVRRGPGRPREKDLDRHILEATLSFVVADEEVTVARIVALSSVSKAALYRRWPSLTTLIAAALDSGRTVPPTILATGDLHETLFAAVLGELTPDAVARFPEALFRQRIRLVMGDRGLQKAYWSSHVTHRRAPMEAAFRAGIERGVLRADLHVEAACDAIIGAIVLPNRRTGRCTQRPLTRARCRAALDTIWRGMLIAP